jgi:hypothetical protein
MFMKVQAYLKCSKIRPKIAPDWNGPRLLKCAFLEVFFLVYLKSKSIFLYEEVLNRFHTMISGQRTSPASFRMLRKRAGSF